MFKGKFLFINNLFLNIYVNLIIIFLIFLNVNSHLFLIMISEFLYVFKKNVLYLNL